MARDKALLPCLVTDPVQFWSVQRVTVLIAGVLERVLGFRHSRSGIKTKSKENFTHVLGFSAESPFSVPRLARQGIAQHCRCSSCAAAVLGVASVLVYSGLWQKDDLQVLPGTVSQVTAGQECDPLPARKGWTGTGGDPRQRDTELWDIRLGMRSGWSSLGNESWRVHDSSNSFPSWGCLSSVKTIQRCLGYIYFCLFSL